MGRLICTIVVTLLFAGCSDPTDPSLAGSDSAGLLGEDGGSLPVAAPSSSASVNAPDASGAGGGGASVSSPSSSASVDALDGGGGEGGGGSTVSAPSSSPGVSDAGP